MTRRTRPVPKLIGAVDTSAIDALLETPEGKWRAARIMCSKTFGVMAPAIRALMPKFFEKDKGNKLGLGTMAVDKYYRCYVNTGIVEYFSQLALSIDASNPCQVCGATEHHELAFTAGVIGHESQHPARDHHNRAKAIDAKPRLWNIAADCELNDDLLFTFKAEHETDASRPRLCLPYFPKLQHVNEKGDVYALHSSVWTHMNPVRFGQDPETCEQFFKGPEFVAQFDGRNLHIDVGETGVVKTYKFGDTVKIGAYELQFVPGKCMTPDMFNSPEFQAALGQRFDDNQIAENYYWQLLDMYDVLNPKDNKDQQSEKAEKQDGDEEGDQGDDGNQEGGEEEGDSGDPTPGDGDQEAEGGKPKPGGDKPGDCDGESDGSDNPFDDGKGGGDGTGDGNGQDCGSGAHGEVGDYEDGDPGPGNPGVSEAEGRHIAREIAEEVKKAQATRGNVAAGLVRWADSVLKPPVVDWRKELKKLVRMAVARSYGHDQRTWCKLGRGAAATGFKFLYPSTFTPIPRVGVVLDTSGSMGYGEDSPLYLAYCEVQGLCTQLGAQLVFVSVDAEAGQIQEITNFKQAAITGGGGTDMRVGIEALEKYKPAINVCVVLTDGFTPWPDRRSPKMAVIAGICCDNDQFEESAVAQVPPHIRHIVIKKPTDEG